MKIWNWEVGVFEAVQIVLGGLWLARKLTWPWYAVFAPIEVWALWKLLFWSGVALFWMGRTYASAKRNKEQQLHDSLVGSTAPVFSDSRSRTLH